MADHYDSASELGTSPRPHRERGDRPRGFLPLFEDSSGSLSARGQVLPALIQSRRRSSALGLREAADEEEGRTRPGLEHDERRPSSGAQLLLASQMRSMRLIGYSNPRYDWEQYWTEEEKLKKMKKPIREYYKRVNSLLGQYMYIDKLLDSSLPHDLIDEYESVPTINIPPTISEEASPIEIDNQTRFANGNENGNGKPSAPSSKPRVKRTPKDIYRVPSEQTPLLGRGDFDSPASPTGLKMHDVEGYDDSSSANIVQVAIYINLAANTVLLAAKIAVTILTSSLSVLASLVDGALDFLSTAIIWTTTRMIAQKDHYAYPIGRRRLEPVGVLMFCVIMILAFFQVSMESFRTLTSGDHSIVELTTAAVIIMASTVVVKGACWFWCRLIKNSSVQALAQDAMTDVVFNIFSIIFPLAGYYLEIWWLDALGGLLLSIYVMITWGRTSATHIRNLTGAAASADQRNVLLYLTMRFAKSIKHIQGLQAYHTGDKLNVEVDIVLDESMTLRDSHDLGESLQYVLESVPFVERAFVHMDYKNWNLPSHMEQDD
ncbi:MAG: hypothetical protein M1814_004560 [Vezdaea aestivalis]|nr:MAG: hypothetical protein M1814_004560 [Vezdaea aestivalis]